MRVERNPLVLRPDRRRVLIRPFSPHSEQQTRNIIARVMALTEVEVRERLERVMVEFRDRHHRLRQFCASRFADVRWYLPMDRRLSEDRELLIGACFTQEYSLESAALFNPSLVWHPDQSGLALGARRFVLSLRAAGEGHISSITFRAGIVGADCSIEVEPGASLAAAAEATPDAAYHKGIFGRKLFELGLQNAFAADVMAGLGDSFTWRELNARLRVVEQQYREQLRPDPATFSGIRALAESNYEVCYTDDFELSERVLFPNSSAEANGIEDARFVQFTDEDGYRVYYATYTAYDGKVVLPQLLETPDFLRFKMSTLNGPEVANKGMALFPRKLDGRYAMISRQDNENLYLMFSENIHFWYDKELLLRPGFAWEFVQLGNCGSPIETEAGWLVLTHGVGPMRKYCMGAMLLDLEDPQRVIGRLPEPLLSPGENEREGYVPNVVYGCGGQVHAGRLIIPYAMSDYASTFATLPLDELLTELTSPRAVPTSRLSRSR
jgi:predicted GH43/DUF377 family glycosyl hydrolase